jgi:hypothetical protein
VNTCQFCGAHFIARHGLQKYCGSDCSTRSKHVTAGRYTKERALQLKAAVGTARKCKHCGKGFSPVSTSDHSAFCSVECYRKYRRTPAYNREGNLRRIYGLTTEAYEKMLTRQNGACYLCRAKPVGRRLAVDHDHATGRIRGLLCTGCNVKLGWYEARKELIAQYLRGH